MPYYELLTGLNAEVAAGNVNITTDGPLVMFKYTPQCVFEKQWNKFNILARGLILDIEANKVVATPFPKFFNHGEQSTTLPDESFEVTEKVDGSLGIIFYHNGRWRIATRGSFYSEQAKWAEQWLYINCNNDALKHGTTYLVEIVYAANRIVITYPYEGLVLLSAYKEDGSEFSQDERSYAVSKIGLRLARVHEYNNLDRLLAVAKALKADKEGFVVRFESGLRVKIKGDEYCRVHRLVSNVTPLAVWDAMASGMNLDIMARELPEEFRKDFEAIRGLLLTTFTQLTNMIMVAVGDTLGMDDKALGLWLTTQQTIPPQVSRWIFPARKKKLLTVIHDPENVMRHRLFETFRPTGNVLPGYVPSSLLNRFVEEEG